MPEFFFFLDFGHALYTHAATLLFRFLSSFPLSFGRRREVATVDKYGPCKRVNRSLNMNSRLEIWSFWYLLHVGWLIELQNPLRPIEL